MTSATEMLDAIKSKKPLELEEFKSSEIKIAPNPFSSSGAERWPYYAQIEDSSIPFVVKRFKEQLGESMEKAHARGRYQTQVYIQNACAAFAKQFNNEVKKAAILDAKPLSFTMATLVEVFVGTTKTMLYNMEKELEGFDKWTNNAGGISIKDELVTAFSHWKHHFSGGVVMISDLQGFLNNDTGIYWLCDPAIHCLLDILGWGLTNLGEKGMDLFFESHKCNKVCKALGLRHR
ncbi:hypothetical protein CEUSTIGMA_g6682.t1 [Chlamydomonas eustigma]|uniref:Alpha-type protein kinase domain-containing protein n=1 Tax=Chlamydomonas eustigma TaxID=1157962 RepID=A0A250X8M5_9CHLO|nr:hypothetical protein CEUSTIGMA_g6682.t1 [Chlamydomonas eustigma]|eukprot:GAX79242.1 hypothetical protein CEUSTIGMA_g6682.t1 [Chlamydomonas eustigma]